MPYSDHAILTNKLEEILDGPAERRDPDLRELLVKVRVEDIAEVLGEFAPEEKAIIFSAVPATDQGEVLNETDPTSTNDLVAVLSEDELAPMVEELDPDDAADIVELIPEEDRSTLLAKVPRETADEVEELLRYDPESAGGIMTLEFIAVRPAQTAAEALAILQKSLDTEVVSYVYVVDDANHLIGVVSIREIIAAKPADLIESIMEREVIFANVHDDQEEVANLARKYNLNSIPIVDAEHGLLGVTTVDDILDIISEEADEDIYRLAGSPANHPAQQRLITRAVGRTPFLLLSVLAGLIIVSMGQNGLEETDQGFDEAAVLVAFLPLVIGLSGGIGTQSATLIARGLATGEVDMSRSVRVFLQETIIGVSIAVFMAFIVAVSLFTMHATGMLAVLNARFLIAVALGLLAGITLGTTCGTAIPLACQRIKVDPALVAGPFVTAFNDVVGAFAFLAIGNLVLGWS